jgi:hypothetical protein
MAVRANSPDRITREGPVVAPAFFLYGPAHRQKRQAQDAGRGSRACGSDAETEGDCAAA